jgi:hypothetical protein
MLKLFPDVVEKSPTLCCRWRSFCQCGSGKRRRNAATATTTATSTTSRATATAEPTAARKKASESIQRQYAKKLNENIPLSFQS